MAGRNIKNFLEKNKIPIAIFLTSLTSIIALSFRQISTLLSQYNFGLIAGAGILGATLAVSLYKAMPLSR